MSYDAMPFYSFTTSPKKRLDELLKRFVGKLSGKNAPGIMLDDKDSLTWSVDTGDTPWLKAVSNTGKIDPGGPEQLIYTIADTGNLAAGNHAGVEHIHSNAGDADIPIKVDVSPPNGKKQARLNVNPSILNLGTLSANRQVTTLVTVGNTGNQDLNWKANTGNTSWLALNRSSGRVQAGGFPQTITVTVKTAHLASGSYSTLLNLTSNGGNFP